MRYQLGIILEKTTHRNCANIKKNTPNTTVCRIVRAFLYEYVGGSKEFRMNFILFRKVGWVKEAIQLIVISKSYTDCKTTRGKEHGETYLENPEQ